MTARNLFGAFTVSLILWALIITVAAVALGLFGGVLGVLVWAVAKGLGV